MSKNYPEIPIFPEDLLLAFKTKKMCLFIGAGVAQNLGMPSWDNLSNQIVDFCYEKKLIDFATQQKIKNNYNPIKAVSYCDYLIDSGKQLNDIKDDYIDLKTNDHNELKKKYNELFINLFLTKPNDKIKMEKGTDGVKIYNILKDISKNALIVQTNYDSVLETITKKTPVLLSNFNDKDNYNEIIYLHGKAEETEDMYKKLVLTRQQYDELYLLGKNKDKHLQKLETIFTNYSVLFLGYSLSDIEILQTITLANSKKASFKQIFILNAYSEANKIDHKIDQQYLETSHGIKSLYYNIDKNGYSIFLKVLEELQKQIPDDRSEFDYLDNFLLYKNMVVNDE